MLRISWPWRLHRDLAWRQRRGAELAAQAQQEEQLTSARARRMQDTARPLREAGEQNQFTELVRAIVAGIDLRSQQH